MSAQTINAITSLRRGRSLSARMVGKGFKEKMWFQLRLEKAQYLNMLMEWEDLLGGRKGAELRKSNPSGHWAPCPYPIYMGRGEVKLAFFLSSSASTSEFSEQACYLIHSSHVMLHNERFGGRSGRVIRWPIVPVCQGTMIFSDSWESLGQQGDQINQS